MALTTTGSSVTLDESTNLQNATATPGAASDANDNDIAVGSLPTVFAARLSALSAGTVLRAALSGYTGGTGDTGSNIISFSPTEGALDVWFTDAGGTALNGVDSGLHTVGGEAIYLYTDSVNNNVLLGKTLGGTIVMAAYLEETGTPVSGAKLWTVQFDAMFHPDGTQADESLDLSGLVFATVDQERVFSLANAPSGQNLFLMYGDAEVAIVATGMSPANQSTGVNINTGDTINSSQAGGSITLGINNQMINTGEGVYFSFVSGANANYTVPNLSEGEADVEANIEFTGLVNSRAATFNVVQLQGDKSATVRIAAYSTALESGVNYIDGLGDADDVLVAITQVWVYDPLGNDVTASRGLSFSGGVATLTGVLSTDAIHYHTSADHQRVLVRNAGNGTNGSASFDIGGFRLLEPQRETVGIGSLIRFEDSAPSITQATPTDTVILNTQDADTESTASDSDAHSFAASFAIASSDYGGDGAGSTVWGYAFSVASQGVDSGLNAAAGDIRLYVIGGKIVGSTSATEGGVGTANTVFDLAVNATSGEVTLTQYSAIEHDGPGASNNYSTQQAVLGAGLAYLNGTVTITDHDGDTDTDIRSLDLGGNVVFDDDGPSVSLSSPTDIVVLNTHDADTDSSATDTDAKSFAAAFAIASDDYGGDGAGSEVWGYTFNVASQGVDSGLDAAAGDIRLYLIGGKIVGSTSATEGGVGAANTVFDLAVNATSGEVTLTQYSAIEHDGPGASSNYTMQQAMLSTGLAFINATVTITDEDGDTDTDTRSIDLAGNVVFNDDGPSVGHFDDLSGPNDGAPMNGTYALDIGADVVGNAAANGLVLTGLSGTTGNGQAIFGTSLTWASETDTLVTYNFGFQYYAGPFDTTAESASGTVGFNKTNGSFQFDMSGLIAGDSMQSTGGPIARYDYDTMGNKSPEIVVQEYSSGIFGVLTGQAALNPSSPASLKAGNNYAFVPGEVLSSATTGYINVATATLGVNSDTMQQGELVNFDLYTANPVSGPTSPPQRNATVNEETPRATTDHLNVVIDQWHEGEDLAIVLKLYNASTQQFTTRMLLADASTDFEAVGKYHVVRIGSDDYDSSGWRICGLQITTSTDRLTGTGYRLSDGSAKALTADGKGFADTADNDVIKLVRIDLDTPVITTYDADLNFTGQVIDQDQDWAGFDFDVHIEADAVVTITGSLPPQGTPMMG